MLSKNKRVSSEDRSFQRGKRISRLTKERQRFTPWLEEQINRGDIDGLEWIDREKGLFKVPWVRVDKPEFVLETHAELFKRWAQHTGKYRQGDQPDPSTWKTRFRCALHKMPDIVEVKELGSLEGSKPYRAFRFKPKLKERSPSFKRPPDKVDRRRRSPMESLESKNSTGTEAAAMSMISGSIEQCEMYCDHGWDSYSPDGIQGQHGYGQSDQEANYFDLQWDVRPRCLLQGGFNGVMFNEYFAFHQLVDVRDLVEPVMPDDWDKYFPEGVQNQYCMSLSQDQATD